MTGTGTTDQPWTLIDHTADLRMEVHGRTIEDLFVNAAKGLASLLNPKAEAQRGDVLEVSVEAEDYEELLVNWLREILFHHEVNGFMLVKPEIPELSPKMLVGRLEGTYSQGGENAAGADLKAVTYHGLSIEKTDEGYTARILFDI